MSDLEYQTRATQRSRLLLVAGGLVAITACAALGLIGLFRDDCTRSYERSPQAVVSSFVAAVSGGDAQGVRKCWLPEPYFDLEAGCTDICLSRILGTRYQVVDLRINDPLSTPDGRARLTASITVTCPENNAEYTGVVVLDALARDVPWRHWKIMQSSFGGTNAEPWCR